MKRSLSRRGFLQTAGAGTVTMWIPNHASGYTAADMRAKAAGGSLIGVSKWELDTPALCVDLDKMDQNMTTMRKKLAATGVASRPHAKTHKCPAIAKLQLAAGSIGVCTAKISEAEPLLRPGGRQSPECAGSLRCRQGSRHRRRRGRRRCRRNALGRPAG